MVKILDRGALNRLVAVVVGTRPGIIKFSPVIRELRRRQLPFTLIHSGQHYSPELDAVFFRDLNLPPPDVQLPSMEPWTTHGGQTGEMLKGIEKALMELQPAALLIGGDANTNLAAALAGRKLGIQVCHDEAGLRSYDWLMPEEHNRVIMDHISEFLFAPNEEARLTLHNERVRGHIEVTGTTIVDAVDQNRGLAEARSSILADLQLEPQSFVLMTIHHEETVDYAETLRNVLAGAVMISQRFELPIVFPAHPRTRKRLDQFGLLDQVLATPGVHLIEPLGYLDFLRLHVAAKLTVSDSGGTIQEAAILGVPCLTAGRATEWKEAVDVGANLVCGTEADSLAAAAELMLSSPRSWTNPFGPPGAASRIVDALEQRVLNGGGYVPPRPSVESFAESSINRDRLKNSHVEMAEQREDDVIAKRI